MLLRYGQIFPDSSTQTWHPATAETLTQLLPFLDKLIIYMYQGVHLGHQGTKFTKLDHCCHIQKWRDLAILVSTVHNYRHANHMQRRTTGSAFTVEFHSTATSDNQALTMGSFRFTSAPCSMSFLRQPRLPLPAASFRAVHFLSCSDSQQTKLIVKLSAK